MEEQTVQLKAHFRRFVIEGDENLEDYGDELILDECWTWSEPENVECWSVVLTPASQHLSFTTKYKNCPVTLPVSLHETITEVSTGPENLRTTQLCERRVESREHRAEIWRAET